MIINLNVKSHYSLLNSTMRIDDIISNAIVNNNKYVALCDDVFFGGALEFFFKAKKNNLIPIIGLAFKLSCEDEMLSINVYAKNYDGFKNIEKISSYLYLNNHVIDYDVFSKYQDNLYVCLDFNSSNVYKIYLMNDMINNEQVNLYTKLFGSYYYYFSDKNDCLFIDQLSEHLDSEKHLIMNEVRCLLKEDSSLLYLLRCIDEQRVVKMSDIVISKRAYMLSKDDIYNNYDISVINNTITFINLFNSFDLLIQDSLPLYKETNELNNNYLIKLSNLGLSKRLNNKVDNIYIERLKFELDVIIKMGYANYFLIVYDYVLFAKTNGILVGPGRGSSAGSLVAYCLGITNVDPIKQKLIFERFLNPERISLPDIDVDFQDDKRDLVIKYLQDKYGYENIAHIITYGTFQARNSLRDLARVLDIPNYLLDNLLKYIPRTINTKLVDVINENIHVQSLIEKNEELKYICLNAIKLEKINRHSSMHAAGIIISSKSLDNYLPIMKANDSALMSQYSMENLEAIGLYKMDILGLKNLSIIADIINEIDNDIDLNKIDLFDRKTFNLMSAGATLGIFQFESEGVIKVLKRMKVDSINDLEITTALFRPGPMQFIDEYIERKNNNKSFTYIHPSLIEVLKDTYGIIVFQEQIMKITQIMANFSLAKADIVRKAMGKKDEKLLVSIKDDFVKSSINNGYSLQVSNEVYEMILRFSNYGFNKAHAYSYALLAYYMAYLKANYPIAFFKSVLSGNVYNATKIKKYLIEMRHYYHLDIKDPDINKSSLSFELDEKSFILPFLSIKGLGEENAKKIINERNNNGLFEDYYDCITRLINSGVNESLLNSLIYAGALDCLGMNRTSMVKNIKAISDYLKILKDAKQLSMNSISLKPRIIKYDSEPDLFEKQFELLGIHLANTPLTKYQDIYKEHMIRDLSNKNDILVYIESIKEIRTKKGELMAFVNVTDFIDNKTLIMFPSIYSMYKDSINRKDVILVNGRIDEKDIDNIIVRKIEKIEKEGIK